MDKRKALGMAEEKGLDLVMVSPTARPVVCKLMDYGKFKYEKGKKEKEAKKKQKIVIVKEIKIKSRIDKHDLEVKLGKVTNFLEKGYKVKVSLMLFGRERMHAEIGMKILHEVADGYEETAVVDRKIIKGQQSFIMLSPKK